MASRKPSRSTQSNRALDQLQAEAFAADRTAESLTEPAPDSPLAQPGRYKVAPEDELGERVRYCRMSKGLTQTQLSELTKSLDAGEKGISRAVLSLYEAGTNRPSPKEIRLLCEALNTTPNFLIYGDTAPFHESNDAPRYGLTWGMKPSDIAFITYLISTAQPAHADAVVKLLLDLARAANPKFEQGAQSKAVAALLATADLLRTEADNINK